MTKDEFIQNSIALHGSSIKWQSSIARRLDISNRHMRRIVSGQSNVSEGLAKDLLRLLGESAPQIVHAKWVLGRGSDGREYLIHTHHPRFQCLIVTDDDKDYNLELDAGVKYTSQGYTLAGFLWLDKMPENITQLLEQACDFVDEN